MPDQVTITFSPQAVVTWLVIGLLAGLLANLFFGRRGFSVARSIVLGLAGALLGALLLSIVPIPADSPLAAAITIRYVDVIASFVGAVIVLIVVNALFRR
jgi:uncharacterized membrane protein YeaQ/YmgE (transglycosylase-associated protein family)